MQYLLESAFCLACFYAFYWLFLRKETFFQANRWYLLATPLLAFVIPAFRITLEKEAPEKAIEVVPFDLPAVVAHTQNAPLTLEHQLQMPLQVGESWSLNIGELMTALYGIGAVILAFLLCFRLWKLWRFIRQCRKEKQGEFTFAIASEGETPVASFFSFVFWNNRNMTENERLIIEHELVHARQWHSLDVLLAEALLVWQWFNPLVYLYRRSLQTVHEYIADDYVVRSTRQRYAYASLLAQQYRDRARPDLLNTFHAQLKNRLIMLAKHPSRAIHRAKFALALPLALGLMLLFSFRLIEKIPGATVLTDAVKKADLFVEKVSHVKIVAPATTTELTPYIFYWGGIQCKFSHTEASDHYFGEVHISPDVFKESLKREPRLWNGQALEQKMTLQVHGMAIASDYYDESVYASTRKSLEEYVVGLNETDVTELSRIPLPGGKFGKIDVFLDAPSPNWLPRDRAQVNWRTDMGNEGSSEVRLEFGEAGLNTANRQFYTVSEFWKMMDATNAVIRLKDGQTQAADKLLIDLFKDRFLLGGIFANEKAARNWQETKEWLAQIKDKIVPGVSIYVDWDSDTQVTDSIFYMADPVKQVFTHNRVYQVATFDLVPDNDPRLSLKWNDRSNYYLDWGNYSGKVINRYARKFAQGNGAPDIYPDRPVKLEDHLFTAKELMQILQLPARLYRGKTLLDNLVFTLQYKDKIVDIQNGQCPPDLLNFIQNNLQPRDELQLSNFKADGVDLSTVSITLEVKPDDPKPALRPTFLPVNGPVEKQVRINSPVPNPATDQTQVSFVLPKACKATLKIMDAQGKVAWSKTDQFPAGSNSLDIRVAELNGKGWFVITLESPFGIVQEELVVE